MPFNAYRWRLEHAIEYKEWSGATPRLLRKKKVAEGWCQAPSRAAARGWVADNIVPRHMLPKISARELRKLARSVHKQEVDKDSVRRVWCKPVINRGEMGEMLEEEGYRPLFDLGALDEHHETDRGYQE